MDNDNSKRIEAKLDTISNLLVGILGTIMALGALQIGESYGHHWEGTSVLLATFAFFATTMSVKRMLGTK